MFPSFLFVQKDRFDIRTAGLLSGKQRGFNRPAKDRQRLTGKMEALPTVRRNALFMTAVFLRHSAREVNTDCRGRTVGLWDCGTVGRLERCRGAFPKFARCARRRKGRLASRRAAAGIVRSRRPVIHLRASRRPSEPKPALRSASLAVSTAQAQKGACP